MSILTRHPLDRLTALVQSCTASGTVRQVLLLHLCRLPPALMRPHHLRLAEAALGPLMRLPRAEMFQLPGPCIAVAWRGDADAELCDVVDTLDHLLADTTQIRPSLPELVSIYDLPACGELLLKAAVQKPPATTGPVAGPVEPVPLDPDTLTTLENCLAHADTSRFARRRSVWRLSRTSATLAWEDRSLSLTELTAALSPGCDLRADPWLFGRLTRTLNQRLLALLSSQGELAAAGPFAIDLHVSSLLSRDFLRFDAALPIGLRRQITIGLALSDIVADAGSVALATAFAAARGYRLLLRLAQANTAALLSPTLRSFDYFAIRWSPALTGEGLPRDHERVVLTGCHTQEAIEWGLAAGVRIFRGAAADSTALVRRPAAA